MSEALFHVNCMAGFSIAKISANFPRLSVKIRLLWSLPRTGVSENVVNVKCIQENGNFCVNYTQSTAASLLANFRL